MALGDENATALAVSNNDLVITTANPSSFTYSFKAFDTYFDLPQTKVTIAATMNASDVKGNFYF